MFAVLLITALFVVISVYFFFRAEKLQHSLLSMRREISHTQKENKAMSKSMALIASNHEEFVKNRLSLLIVKAELGGGKDNVELLKPLINNYANIFRECLLGKGKMQSMIKKCYQHNTPEDFKKFTSVIIKSDPKIQRLWASNNLAGFISLVESLLMKYGEQEKSDE